MSLPTKREAKRLLRDHQNDPEAHGSAAAHEQLARAKEISKESPLSYWWLVLIALGHLFAAARYLG